MNNFKILIAACLLFSFASCDKFLDKKPLNVLSEKIVWSDPVSIKLAANQFYTFLPTGFTSAYLPASYTDDAQLVSSQQNSVSGYTTGDFFSSSFPKRRLWVDSYEKIREVNSYLEKAKKSTVLTEDEKNTVLGQAHFFRAFLYYQLFNAFQTAPLIKVAQPVEEASFKPQKATLAEAIQFIKDELALASDLLPDRYDASEYGKVTKHTAAAFSSRVLLWYASPLTNPGGDKERWQEAADAAKRVIESNQYSLANQYLDVFRVKNVLTRPEVILEYRYNGIKGEKMHSFDLNNVPYGYGGRGYNTPTQDLVDAYEMRNGESILSPTSGYDPSNPYENRDPRFAASILFNGATFKGRQVETFSKGKDMPNTNASPTGYYIRKFIDEDFDFNKDPSKGSSTNWIIMRYAEVLLNYAEAENEANGPTQSAVDALNLVRARAQMPRVGYAINQDELRKRIRNERRVELAFEDEIRYQDLKRWKVAHIVLNNVVSGMRIEKNSDNTFSYVRNPNVGKRQFEERNYWFPYSIEDLRVNPNLNPQNTGW